MAHIKRRSGVAAAVAAAVSVIVLPAGSALAGLTPAAKCEALKNKEAGKYVFCLQKAEMKLIKTAGVCSVAGTLCYRDSECPSSETCSKDLTKYNAAIDKCEQKFSDHWTKWEEKAGGACPTTDDEAAAQAYLTDHSARLAEYLLGDIPLGDPPLQSGQTACYDSGGSVISCSGTGQDGEFQKGIGRDYTDNADGTITDNRTGLMWEKLSSDGSVHDVATTYTWTNAFSKIAALNSAAFAGHTDWRLPNVKELQSLADFGQVGPAIDPVFNTACAASCTVTSCSCTQSDHYWTSTTAQDNPDGAWHVSFNDGGVDSYGKVNGLYVRAVRGDR